VRIGPDVPDNVIRQTDDWSCSVRASYAAQWIYDTLAGLTPVSYEGWKSRMVPQYADWNVGLKDGSGQALSELFRSTGIAAFNINPATLANVQHFVRAGNLVLIGGRSWGTAGHWALVVGVEDDGTLMLANPAGCYNLGGTSICTQLLTSWSKSAWSAVVVPVPQAAPPFQPPPLPPGDNSVQRIAALERELADCRNLVGNAYNSDGEVRKALAALNNWLEANRPK
jgi:hypothetical protein